jgi:hypothetical protein
MRLTRYVAAFGAVALMMVAIGCEAGSGEIPLAKVPQTNSPSSTNQATAKAPVKGKSPTDLNGYQYR